MVKLNDKFVAAIYLNPNTGERYAVTFKREWYHRFGRDFACARIAEKGWGQIGSRDLLVYCVETGVKFLVAVMPRGEAYVIEANEFLDYADEFKTDVSKTPGKAHLVGEVACPIRMWRRFYP